MEINLIPVATVKNSRTTLMDDFWGDVISEIELAKNIPTETLDDLYRSFMVFDSFYTFPSMP